MTRRERKERKLARRLEWAEKAEGRAETRFGAASRLADQIPLGQPILVGHHSEGRARRDAECIRTNMDRGCEAQKLAKHHRAQAAGIARQLDNSIFSDDPDAIEQLEARIAKAEAVCERKKALNRAWKKEPDAVLALGFKADALARMQKVMADAPWLKLPADTTHDRAQIRRDRTRLKELQERAAVNIAAEMAPTEAMLTAEPETT